MTAGSHATSNQNNHRRCAPPPDIRAYHEELAQYIFTHRHRFRASQERREHRHIGVVDDQGSESDNEADLSLALREGRIVQVCGGLRSKKLKDSLISDLVGFFQLFNGPLWGHQAVHHCTGCCRDLQDCRAHLTKAAKQLLFRARPEVPAVNRWSKLGPALDIILPLATSHDLLHRLLRQMGSGVNLEDEAHHDIVDDQIDDALKADDNFSKVHA